MAEKVTTMVLKVDLQCPHCRKKIKKILCKFPQIRDQSYDEKQNTVTIKVVCCSPEKIRDKLCCKGGKTITSIDILPPPKKPEPKKPPEQPKGLEKPPELEKPKPKKPPEKPKEPEKPRELEKPKPPEKPPEKPKETEKPKEPEKPKPPEKPKEPEKPKAPEKPKLPEKPKENPKPDPPPPLPMPEPVSAYPIGICCGPCYEGRVGGPCYHGYGVPPPPPPGPCYDSYGGYGRGYCGSRGDCFSDENPYACTIM